MDDAIAWRAISSVLQDIVRAKVASLNSAVGRHEPAAGM